VQESAYEKLAYTIEEAAKLLSLSRAHVYRLIDIQELGSITIGRSRRVTASQLRAFIERLEARSTSQRF
jgi:excisionase family DNA binding protein